MNILGITLRFYLQFLETISKLSKSLTKAHDAALGGRPARNSCSGNIISIEPRLYVRVYLECYVCLLVELYDRLFPSGRCISVLITGGSGAYHKRNQSRRGPLGGRVEASNAWSLIICACSRYVWQLNLPKSPSSFILFGNVAAHPSRSYRACFAQRTNHKHTSSSPVSTGVSSQKAKIVLSIVVYEQKAKRIIQPAARADLSRFLLSRAAAYLCANG